MQRAKKATRSARSPPRAPKGHVVHANYRSTRSGKEIVTHHVKPLPAFGAGSVAPSFGGQGFAYRAPRPNAFGMGALENALPKGGKRRTRSRRSRYW